MTGIDNWLSTFDVDERHEISLPSNPEQALRLALAAPAAPDAFVRILFRLRGLRPDGSIQHFMAANGFTVLEQPPTTLWSVFWLAAAGCPRLTPLPGGSPLRRAQ